MKHSNVINFPGRPLHKVTEENVQKSAKLVELAKEYAPTAFYAVLWVVLITVANI